MSLWVLWEQELTVASSVTWDASAHIASVPLVTSCTVVARIVDALVDRRGAVLPSVSRRTGTCIVVESILACAAILARIVGTLIDVVFTMSSSETLRTLTEIGVYKI